MTARIIPVIMCGGAGTRLWPMSRESMPKQFVPLIGEGSTFQQVLRASRIRDLFARPIVITHSDFRFVVAEQLRECGIEADIVLEPVRRNSGPAVAVAAAARGQARSAGAGAGARGRSRHPQPDQFRDACRSAAIAAAEGRIVTFGIEPTYPATNYGYIRPGDKLNGASVRAVEAFVEKPDADDGRDLSCRALSLEQRQLPVSRRDHARRDRALRAGDCGGREGGRHGPTHDLDFLRLAPDCFASAPKKSIDYAVMERTSCAAVVPADMGWSDIGSWNAVWDVLDHDAAGNATEGPVVMLDSRNSLVRADESVLTAVVGLDDVVVVSTADAVLVASRAQGRAGQDAGRAAQGAEPARGDRASPHLPPVGLLSGRRYLPAAIRVKRIVVKPGGSFRCKSISIAPSIGSWSRARPKSRWATKCASCTRTNRSIFRSAAFTGSPIPARSRSS